jgi:hypothetical protein
VNKRRKRKSKGKERNERGASERRRVCEVNEMEKEKREKE